MSETISRYKVVASITRGFFEGFVSGVIDCRETDSKKKSDPLLIKQITADYYDKFGNNFVNVLFPLLIAMNFESYEDAVKEMNAKHFSNDTSAKLLIRFACGKRSLYESMMEEYKQQMYSLLSGKIQPVSEHLANWRDGDEMEEYDTDHAIRSTVRALMHGYSLGIKSAGTGKESLHQATVFRMMIDGMHSLLHEKAFNVYEDSDKIGLDGIFQRVCITPANYETLVNEMNQAYEDLARAEGIKSSDDNNEK